MFIEFQIIIFTVTRINNAQNIKFSINDFFVKCGQVPRKLRI